MGWFPGAQRDPAGRAGTTGNAKRQIRLHYTVGTNSHDLIRNKNLCHFLISRDGTVWQFGPTEAIFYDACEWNVRGWGIEFESLDGALTDAQIRAGGEVLRWGSAADGIPLDYRDSPGDRLPVGGDHHGVITHRSLHEVKCDEHYDGFPPEVFAQMIGGAPATQTPEGSTMKVVAFNVPGTGVLTYLVDGFLVKQFPSTPAGPFGISQEGAAFAASAGLGPVAVLGKDELDKYAANAPGAVRTFLAKLFPAKAARAGA